MTFLQCLLQSPFTTNALQVQKQKSACFWPGHFIGGEFPFHHQCFEDVSSFVCSAWSEALNPEPLDELLLGSDLPFVVKAGGDGRREGRREEGGGEDLRRKPNGVCRF